MTERTNSRILTNVHMMVAIAIMAALTCVLAPLSIPIPVGEVPLSFTILVIYFSAIILGFKGATLSYLLYLLIGAVGLPVFGGYKAGIGVLVGPTGGYLVAFILLAAVCGYAVQHWDGKRLPFIVAALIGMVAVYGLGTLWLSHEAHLSLKAALAAGVIPFIPIDTAKILVAVLVGFPLRKALKRAGVLPGHQ